MSTLRVAAIQLTSRADVEANLQACAHWCEQAAKLGAKLAVLPENFAFMGPEAAKIPLASPLSQSTLLRPLRQLARQHSMWILGGGMPEQSSEDKRCYNTAVLLNPDGEVAAAYRKIHLFDVELADGFSIRESASVVPGAPEEVVVCEVEGWQIGLSICYDLRFPELYRALVTSGADIITVPAAFTLHTGKDHWDVLLRARAIENQCFLLAAAQFGRSDESRVCWGKTQVIDPWGTQLAIAPERPGVVCVDLQRQDLQQARTQLPVLRHRRMP